MKYQIILERDANIPDDEFLKYVKTLFAGRSKYKIIEARSLDGIREEAYVCEAMKKIAVQELDSWEKEHSKHLKRGQKYKVEEVARHPEHGPMDKIACSCGRSIITFRKQKQRDILD